MQKLATILTSNNKILDYQRYLSLETATCYLYFRAKLPSGCSQRDAIIFSKKLSAQEAKTLQLVDVVTKEDKLLDSAAKLIWTALGPKGLDRTILTNVKRDIYGNSILSKM